MEEVIYTHGTALPVRSVLTAAAVRGGGGGPCGAGPGVIWHRFLVVSVPPVFLHVQPVDAACRDCLLRVQPSPSSLALFSIPSLSLFSSYRLPPPLFLISSSPFPLSCRRHVKPSLSPPCARLVVARAQHVFSVAACRRPCAPRVPPVDARVKPRLSSPCAQPVVASVPPSLSSPWVETRLSPAHRLSRATHTTLHLPSPPSWACSSPKRNRAHVTSPPSGMSSSLCLPPFPLELRAHRSVPFPRVSLLLSPLSLSFLAPSPTISMEGLCNEN